MNLLKEELDLELMGQALELSENFGPGFDNGHSIMFEIPFAGNAAKDSTFIHRIKRIREAFKKKICLTFFNPPPDPPPPGDK